MPAKPLTERQLADAAELKSLFRHWQAARRIQGAESSQEWAAEQMGFGQSALNQYLNGKIPLNPEAASKFAQLLGVEVGDFSEAAAEEIAQITARTVLGGAARNVRLPGAGGPPAVATDYLPGFEKMSVPLLANSGSMGQGDDQLHEEVMTGSLPVSPEWALRTLKPTSLQNLRFIHGYGDSMKGTFEDGDILLVDIGVKDPRIDGVYVLEANDRIYIKRVRQRINGEFEISSDNPKVKTIDVLDGNTPVECRGRVLWAWNGVKL
ncbi:S24 family peptidase [Xenophilus sp. Marseille-Q4582]|uniref:LexA family transcriptional regulator n=1 Tax=Xenophilus sp. Marseille-Q4582 TaxID=2866600 RepID=UPI001CE46D42|nr:S24 family peptidase [Xenophilus sp. Marseille-Q4582]